MSKTFDAISSVAFLMPLICIEKYDVYFACASWVLGDIVLVGVLLAKSAILLNRKKSDSVGPFTHSNNEKTKFTKLWTTTL